jgi:hypothetical protein
VACPRKKAADEGRTVVWVDPSGCSLLPLAVRTWAPCGQTPIVRVPLTHDHLAAISGSTANGRLFMQTQDQAYHSPAVVRFLRLLRRKVRGKLLVIGDGAPIHRGQPSPARTSCTRAPPGGGTWSSCRGMPQRCIRTRASGTT